MPQALARYVQTDNATLLTELYSSIYVIAAYPAADPVRTGAIEAYGHVMKVRATLAPSRENFTDLHDLASFCQNLCIGATVVAIFPPIIAYFFSEFRCLLGHDEG